MNLLTKAFRQIKEAEREMREERRLERERHLAKNPPVTMPWPPLNVREALAPKRAEAAERRQRALEFGREQTAMARARALADPHERAKRIRVAGVAIAALDQRIASLVAKRDKRAAERDELLACKAPAAAKR